MCILYNFGCFFFLSQTTLNFCLYKGNKQKFPTDSLVRRWFILHLHGNRLDDNERLSRWGPAKPCSMKLWHIYCMSIGFINPQWCIYWFSPSWCSHWAQWPGLGPAPTAGPAVRQQKHFGQLYKPATRRRDANMQMIRQRVFSIHTKHDANMRLKFTGWMKFWALSVAPEKNKGLVNTGQRRWKILVQKRKFYTVLFLLGHWSSCYLERFLVFLWIDWFFRTIFQTDLN